MIPEPTHADLGGTTGHGAVTPEAENERFHAPWEPRALALTLAMGATGAWNIDTSRAARETLPDYERLGYYAIWLAALERLLLERGLLQPGELERTVAVVAAPSEAPPVAPAPPVPRVLRADDVGAVLARGSPTSRPGSSGPYAVGDRVRARDAVVAHHTRLPGYVRGKVGRVAAVHGPHVYPDDHARGLGERPRPLYTVVFDGRELWGDGAEGDGLTVSVDAWEPYLEAAP